LKFSFYEEMKKIAIVENNYTVGKQKSPPDAFV
jgi:hypothetical protein